MRRGMIAAAVCGALLALAPAAQADEVPSCNAEDELVDLTPPRWANAGKQFAVPVDVTRADHVREFTMTVDGQPAGVTLGPDGDGTLYLDTPSRSGRFELTASWQQTGVAAGDLPLCRQEFVYDVYAVAPNARIGREEPRIDGRWNVVFRPTGRTPGGASRTRWRFTPDCAVGACALRAVLDGSVRYRLVPDARMRYSIPRSRLDASWARCGPVRHGADSVLQYGFEVVGSQLVDGVVGERATRISGRATITYTPTPAGRRAGCRTVVYPFVMSGVRVGG
ncbi:hypothetical protein Q5424_06145 [Conexibacter sp. JD483]|uniref:hypothetical protein n=1 Tax=unclassified Conexibacter TaxID=2627773 RepID=UPI0027244803|nr:MULTISPECIES: hypothetical protein [unclassified Conexibacter]MDO8185163.1 hypothetical protein [Conexibacter sp. CPCC 205706]MDO8196873.1 hypothetical protein [Conexibacter sp. CPCC 205762]MDR9368649.1 hypothetical protein [Conexibacter sp. JD483]